VAKVRILLGTVDIGANDTTHQGNIGGGPVSLRLGFASEDYGYAIDLGLPTPRHSAFSRVGQELPVDALATRPRRCQTIADLGLSSDPLEKPLSSIPF